jgi:hypothetical protein
MTEVLYLQTDNEHFLKKVEIPMLLIMTQVTDYVSFQVVTDSPNDAECCLFFVWCGRSVKKLKMSGT